MKLTAKAPENGWLEYDPFLLGRPIFKGELLVSGRGTTWKLDGDRHSLLVYHGHRNTEH